ncbi:hypothetical protein JB92DRAFT_2755311 [Gautieria morchelliformis]|nr:hypothetical protein JB92DRAFT_2755311 [Gautieria morchelliformis]
MSDPRDPSLEAPYSLPKSWGKETEGLAAMSMFISGLVMVTRNKYLAWPAVLVAITGYVGCSTPLTRLVASSFQP